MNYKKILVAVSLEPAADQAVFAKAQEFKQQYQADLTFVHAIEHLSNYGTVYGISMGIEVEEQLYSESKTAMHDLIAPFGVDEAHQIIKPGIAKYVIVDLAKEMNADLIILGSHGRHGVGLLLGSTANGVIHNAHCDVLAVRVKS